MLNQAKVTAREGIWVVATQQPCAMMQLRGSALVASHDSLAAQFSLSPWAGGPGSSLPHGGSRDPGISFSLLPHMHLLSHSLPRPRSAPLIGAQKSEKATNQILGLIWCLYRPKELHTARGLSAGYREREPWASASNLELGVRPAVT